MRPTTTYKALHQHIRRLDKFIPAQLERRPYPTSQSPVTTGALDSELTWLRDKLAYRAMHITNAQRTNAMLLLMLLEKRGDGAADEVKHGAAIRDWLLSGGGRPKTVRRAVADPRGRPSLRP